MMHSQRRRLHKNHWLMSNLWLGLLATVAVLMFSDADHLCAQQTTVPTGISDVNTTFFGQIDASVIDTLLKELPNEGKGKGAEAKETVLENRLRQTKEILGGETIWLTANWPRVPTKITLSVADADGTRVSKLLKLWSLRTGKLVANQRFSVSLKSLRDVEKQSDSPVEDWQKNLAGAPKGPLRFAMQPPKRFYRTLDELLNELPEYLGGGPVELLTEGALSASISANPATRSIDGFIQSKNAEAANKLKDHLPKLLTSAIESHNLSNEGDGSIALILRWIARKTSFSVEQDRIRIQFEPKSDASAAELTRQAMNVLIGPIANQSQTEKLRYAAIGILNYESAYRYFPPPEDFRGPDGATGLSWRVHILPFLGESELFQKFKLDEPWDSPANKKLLSEMPDIYNSFPSQLMMPVDAPKGMTTLMAPASDSTILGAPKRVTFGNIVDGSSNTVLLVIVKDSLAVPWTAPKDYVFDPDKPAAGLQFDNGKTPVVMCDASTHAADRDNQWLRLFEMNDEKVVQLKE